MRLRESLLDRLRYLPDDYTVATADPKWTDRIVTVGEIRAALKEQKPSVGHVDPDGKRIADEHLAYFGTDDYRTLTWRVMNGTATIPDRLKYIETELIEAMHCLEPEAPSNGRGIDGWHASACALRAYAEVLRLAALLVVEGGARPQDTDEEKNHARVEPLVGLDGQDLTQRDNESLPLSAERTER